MEPIHAESLPSSSLPHRKITRQELAAHTSLSLRYVDELVRNGVLPFYKIGKSIRFDIVETEAALRERFHVRAKPTKRVNKGTRSPSD